MFGCRNLKFLWYQWGHLFLLNKFAYTMMIQNCVLYFKLFYSFRKILKDEDVYFVSIRRHCVMYTATNDRKNLAVMKCCKNWDDSSPTATFCLTEKPHTPHSFPERNLDFICWWLVEVSYWWKRGCFMTILGIYSTLGEKYYLRVEGNTWSETEPRWGDIAINIEINIPVWV